MNIFVLHLDPKLAAEYHCDKHVVKMIVESAQMISTVLDKYGNHKKWMLKPCFQNHPCTLWAGESKRNLKWLVQLGIYLNIEYTKRYNKQHSYYGKFLLWEKMIENSNLPSGKFTTFALALTPELKEKAGTEYTMIKAINLYREYYIVEKSYMAKWKLGNTPKWYSEGLEAYSVNNQK